MLKPNEVQKQAKYKENCCKLYHGTIPAEDVEKDARHLGISGEEFKNLYLDNDMISGAYDTKHMPCDFLQENGICMSGGV